MMTQQGIGNAVAVWQDDASLIEFDQPQPARAFLQLVGCRVDASKWLFLSRESHLAQFNHFTEIGEPL
jgi:hypothetical protein